LVGRVRSACVQSEPGGKARFRLSWPGDRERRRGAGARASAPERELRVPRRRSCVRRWAEPGDALLVPRERVPERELTVQGGLGAARQKFRSVLAGAEPVQASFRVLLEGFWPMPARIALVV